jgi:hypothetical protein
MRIDFSPRLQMNPLAFAQAGLGIVQGVAGFLQQRKATKQLENMQSPTYTQNKGILDYYNKSLAKYNVNPYQTDLYRMQEQQANRGLSSGLSALSGRGQALAGVNSLVQGRNDNLLKAGAMAEQQSAQDLNRLGQAAGMKAGEDQMAFNINQQQPFERRYNLKSMKAGGGVDIMNSGISNIFGAGNTYMQSKQLENMYGSGGGSSSYSGGSGMGADSYGNSVLQGLNRNRSMGIKSTDRGVYNQLMENRNRRVG